MTTHQLVRDAAVCVPASQAAAYRRRLACVEVVAHPDDVKGKAGKLNWWFDHHDDDCVVFLDDDLAALRRCWLPRGQGDFDVRDPDHVMAVIENTAVLAADMGAKVFGFATSARNATMHRVMQPFALHGFLNGTGYGFRRGHGLRFDLRLTAKADYDISCQAIYRHRYCLRNDRYAWVTRDTFTAGGGSATRRNSVTEKADIAVLRRKWGDVVKVKEDVGYRAGLMGRKNRAGTMAVELSFPL